MSEFSENEQEKMPDVPEEMTEEVLEETVEKPQADAERVVYRWNYDEQVAHDAHKAQQKRRHGVILYACVMSAVFLLCIAVLLGVILWSGMGQANWGSHDLSEIGAAAQSVSPSTVLIEGSTLGGVSYGTGFFLTADGYIATNYHVIKGASTINVTLYSGKTYTAKAVGYYAPDDLAVLKIDGNGHPVLRVGNSDAVLMGDTVIAIGNPSGADAAWTTTHGIVSSTSRRVLVSDGDFTGSMKMIQTDAPVNPGNSGGPLCNLRGEVIGIVTQKLSGYEGMGFAIPINEAMHTLQAIIDGELDSFVSTVTKKRPSIGVMVESIYEGETYQIDGEVYTAPCDGMLVSSVVEGSGAADVLLYGDLIYEFDGKPVQNAQVLQNALFAKEIGDRVKIKVYRGKYSMEFTVRLS